MFFLIVGSNRSLKTLHKNLAYCQLVIIIRLISRRQFSWSDVSFVFSALDLCCMAPVLVVASDNETVSWLPFSSPSRAF